MRLSINVVLGKSRKNIASTFFCIHTYVYALVLSVTPYPAKCRPSQDGQSSCFIQKFCQRKVSFSSTPPLPTPGNSPQIGQDRSRDLNTGLPTGHILVSEGLWRPRLREGEDWPHGLILSQGVASSWPSCRCGGRTVLSCCHCLQPRVRCSCGPHGPGKDHYQHSQGVCGSGIHDTDKSFGRLK